MPQLQSKSPPPQPIHSTFSATQIPTLNSNHTHYHPHLHPSSHLLRHPGDSPKRSISYNATPTHTATPVATTTTTTATRQPERHDDLTCDHKVKGALTELLNDGSVKADDRGRRSVQRLLMETERELRTQRRESLGGKRSRRGSMALELSGSVAGSRSGSLSRTSSSSVSRESIAKGGNGEGKG